MVAAVTLKDGSKFALLTRKGRFDCTANAGVHTVQVYEFAELIEGKYGTFFLAKNGDRLLIDPGDTESIYIGETARLIHGYEIGDPVAYMEARRAESASRGRKARTTDSRRGA